jgi:cytochrome c oxidase assembly protein subunit 15
MSRSSHNPWLKRCAVLTAIATLGLIGAGGLVTSQGMGMAVPDWPTTYGYNLFRFPIRYWNGGILYEHSHRLFAAAVGLLTSILAVWLWRRESRNSLRRLGMLAFGGMVLQGLLGGFRVLFDKYGLGTELGVFHATVAQLCLVLVSAIALFTTDWWQGSTSLSTVFQQHRTWRLGFLCATLLILGQLVLGATMRHQHAGLAVPDFPLAYGRLWPATDAATLEAINQRRVDARDYPPVTAFQIHLHMAHRIGALLVCVAIGVCAWRVPRGLGWGGALSGITLAWFGLVLVQGCLGALTVLTNKPADLATLHVVVGATTLVAGALLTIVAYRPKPATVPSALPVEAPSQSGALLPATQPAASSS